MIVILQPTSVLLSIARTASLASKLKPFLQSQALRIRVSTKLTAKQTNPSKELPTGETVQFLQYKRASVVTTY
jgi:hypothetical protein